MIIGDGGNSMQDNDELAFDGSLIYKYVEYIIEQVTGDDYEGVFKWR